MTRTLRGVLAFGLATLGAASCSDDESIPSDDERPTDAETGIDANTIDGDVSEDSADDPVDDSDAGLAVDSAADPADDTFEDSSDENLSDTPDAAPSGEELYDRYCAFCHGDEGQGYVSDNANALAQQDFLATADDEFLTLATVHGRPGTPMSAWGVEKSGPLDDDQVAAVVAYIRGWQIEPTVELSDEPIEGSSLRGQGAYNVNCARCHGENGEGVTAISLNNPWFLETASDAFIAYAIRHGRPGAGMDGYAESLPERTINDITALIRSWQRPVDTDPPPPYEPDLEALVLNPDGDEPDWEIRDDRYVSIHAVHASLEAGESLALIDARPTADFLTSHITGAQNIPFYRIEEFVDELPRDRWIVAYCGCPHAVSGQAADALLAAGFTQVAVLDEGFYEWEDAGYPVTDAE